MSWIENHTLVALALLFFFAGSVGAQGEQFRIVGAPSSLLGETVDVGSDVDGDGIRDIFAGAPFADTGAPSGGEVQCLSGSTGAVIWRVIGTTTSGGLGRGLDAIPDVTGDGIGDVLAGAPKTTGFGVGQAFLLSGADGSVVLSWSSPQPDDVFGVELTEVGDWSGDGVRDVAIAGPDIGPGSDNNEVYVHDGRTGALIQSFTGYSTSFGAVSLACPGDWDGDGEGELAVGYPFYSQGIFRRGRVLVFSSKGSHAVIATVQGSSPGQALGSEIEFAGDLSGDGVGDLLVGSGALGFAEAYEGPGATFWQRYESEEGEPGFGSKLAPAGDVDGDGTLDVVIGSAAWDGPGLSDAGRVYVFRATGELLVRISGREPGEYLGSAVAGGRRVDLDLDGLADVVVGAWGVNCAAGDRCGSVFTVNGSRGYFEGYGTGGPSGLLQRGIGLPTTGGFPVVYRVEGAEPGEAGVFGVGLQPAAQPQSFGTLWIDAIFATAPWQADATGVFETEVALANLPATAGVTLYTQALSLPDLRSSGGLRWEIVPGE